MKRMPPLTSHILTRLRAYCKHALSAWNTSGEGIHSPYLFYLVRLLLPDEHAYYVWQDIERQRDALLHNTQRIHVVDYGTGKECEDVRCVCDIANSSLESPRMAQLFFRWLVYMSHEAQRPLEIAELGTSLGITTAYLAAAHSHNHVLTFEGSHSIAQVARKTWQALHLQNITLLEGNLDTTLTSVPLPQYIDFAFVDANHTEEATCRYVQTLLPYLHDKSILFVDDIHHSPAMERAWHMLKALPQVTTTMDFFYAGALFFDPHYLKKHYRLRL